MIIVAYEKEEICLKTMVFLLKRPEAQHSCPKGGGRQASREVWEEKLVLATHTVIHPNQQKGATGFLLALLK